MNTINDYLTQRISTFDTQSLAKQFARHQLLVMDNFLPQEFVLQHYVPEIEQCNSRINRVYVAGFKKSGSVSAQLLKHHGPKLHHLYHNDAMQQFIAHVVRQSLFLCPEVDPHAVALYYYTEQGDHIGFHYDKSFYRGKRYTVLLGLVQDSVHSNLICYPEGKHSQPLTVVTKPGTLVMFNGDVLWHKVSPLGENERRVILTLEYVTDTRMSVINKYISNFKDRFLYFGKPQYAN